MTGRKRVRKKAQTIRAIAASTNKPVVSEQVSGTFEPLVFTSNPEFALITKRFSAQPLVETESSLPTENASVVSNVDSGPLVKRRKTRYSLVGLKERTTRPELVQLWDTNAKEPELLVELKSCPGVVQVPPTWQGKKDYFRNRFYRRPPYKLPQNIKDTDIMALRNVEPEAESLAQKARERVQPKLGKLDVDFRKLHAAFFKFQSKPKLSGFGMVFDPHRQQTADVDPDQFQVGELSDRLRAALGLAPMDSPPWAKVQEKLGPPSHQNPAHRVEHWGEMVLDAEPDLDEDSENEEDSEDSNDSGQPENRQLVEPEPQEPDSFEVHYEPDSEPEVEAETGPLYRELSESTAQGSLGPAKKYNL